MRLEDPFEDQKCLEDLEGLRRSRRFDGILVQVDGSVLAPKQAMVEGAK